MLRLVTRMRCAWPTTRWQQAAQFSTTLEGGVGAPEEEEQATTSTLAAKAETKAAAHHRNSKKRWSSAKYRLTSRDVEAFEIFRKEHGHLIVPILFEKNIS